VSLATQPGLRADEWLGERLGRPAYTVDGDLPAKLEPGFYQARVPVGDSDRVGALKGRGFRLVDVNQQLERAAGPLRAEPIAVDAVRPDQHDAVLAIAEHAFEYDRFHLDDQIPDAVADRIKRDWVASYLAGTRGDRLWVAEVDGRPAGFLAELRRDGASVIDLIAVATQFRGAGVARALIAKIADRPLVVGTQAGNAPSLKLYQRAGFLMRSATAVLHLHVGEGA
jgi:ribosomal protein S18 acetylase RimI-like enzyme